jgi:hypothetical protein
MTVSTYAHVMRELKGLAPLSAEEQIQAAREARGPSAGQKAASEA